MLTEKKISETSEVSGSAPAILEQLVRQAERAGANCPQRLPNAFSEESNFSPG
jgi:pyrroline-5-carboxylate reductase